MSLKVKRWDLPSVMLDNLYRGRTLHGQACPKWNVVAVPFGMSVIKKHVHSAMYYKMEKTLTRE